MGKETSINQGEVLGNLSQLVGNFTVEGNAITGSINETLILRRDNGKRLVLQRDVLGRGAATLLEEQRFLEYLKVNGFPGVSALKFDSYPFFRHDDEIYLVYPFIEGEVLDIDEPIHHELAPLLQ